MLVNERISPGTVLEIYMKEEKGDRVGMAKKRVEVIRQYPHHILVKTENGIRMCITHAELRQYEIVTKRF
ncbi:hypothetical protein [Eisenbergiella porci]|uniref:hypothetical protein n=1 Tax=Eisenbergiella porci TaxID=2652274 RepID=UPI002A81BB4D|nr:hypothetical protein [Eisenbergiella porci]